MSSRIRTKKKEITLMTLLANEATGDSRRLLKKYKQPDAKSYEDLEQKLSGLYTSEGDKLALEKELAAIHPHKNWLFRTLKPEPAPEIKKEEIKTEVLASFNGPEKRSCDCTRCMMSSFNGTNSAVQQPNTQQQAHNTIALVGVIAMAFYLFKKQ